MNYVEHFGVRAFDKKYGLKLTREKYALIKKKSSLPYFKSMKENYEDEAGKFYKDEWCISYQKLCLENFDLNMLFFQSLDNTKFKAEINAVVDKYSLKPVEDLKQYDYCGGYYLMVLDEYNQVYVGYSTNIRKRIQQHWSASKSLDRLLFPMYKVKSSRLSIDSFRPLDTTRLYAIKRRHSKKFEDTLIKSFSDDFVINRINGGFPESIFSIKIKSRKLIQDYIIRSGGQSGVDRAVLDSALKLNVTITGWCPKGGWAEDYITAPGLLIKYPQLKETPLKEVNQRTEWNVRDSDVTLIFGGLDKSKGTQFTVTMCKKYNKSYLLIKNQKSEEVYDWLMSIDNVKDINIAGPRESEAKGIYKKTYQYMIKLLELLKN